MTTQTLLPPDWPIRPVVAPDEARAQIRRLRRLLGEAQRYLVQVEVDADLDCGDLASGYAALVRQTVRQAAAAATVLEEVLK